jgi:hypothetical protein
VAAVLVQMASNLWLLRREYARRLVAPPPRLEVAR